MFKDDLFEEIEHHRNEGSPAALAMVVRRESPSSGKPGDKAIITTDGEVKGWVGGGCTKGIVIKEAMEAISQQSPRLVRIQPKAETQDAPGTKNYRMTCMSGGTVEVYIEPIMQISQIQIFGRSHIARALCQVGTAAGFRVNMISNLAEAEMFPSAHQISKLSDFEPHTPMPNDFVVVCTQGEDDEKSVLRAIEGKPKYLAFVSSRKKANSIFVALKRQGIPHDELVRIKTPAGLDINAKTPEEVAISILAEIIKVKRSEEATPVADLEKAIENNQDDLYINPVCKIPVQKSTAKHVLEHRGEKVYFCCDGCKVSFEKEPELYMS